MRLLAFRKRLCKYKTKGERKEYRRLDICMLVTKKTRPMVTYTQGYSTLNKGEVYYEQYK